MSMQWVTLRQQQETDGMVTVDRHWYLTEDRSRVVEESSSECRWLWASPGTAVPLREAVRLGAVQLEQEALQVEPEPTPEPVEPEAKPEAKPEEKKAPPAANKAAKKAPNKAGTETTEDK